MDQGAGCFLAPEGVQKGSPQVVIEVVIVVIVGLCAHPIDSFLVLEGEEEALPALWLASPL
jgi:hypothetical protein